MELIIFLAVIVVLIQGAKKLDGLIHRRRAVFGFGLADIPLSAGEWQRFSAFAVAKNVQTKTLLADAVKYYLQEKVK